MSLCRAMLLLGIFQLGMCLSPLLGADARAADAVAGKSSSLATQDAVGRERVVQNAAATGRPGALQLEATRLVSQALASEALGELVERDQLLTQAAQCDSSYPAAQWHRGRLLDQQGRWQDIDACLGAPESMASLAAYEARRDAMGIDAQSQCELAVWCFNNGYAPQARAHLQSALDVSPDHPLARRLLGFQAVGNQWVSAAQSADLVARAQRSRDGLTTYGKRVTTIARDLNSRHLDLRRAAHAQLMEISDPLATAPIETILGNSSPQAAEAAVECLANINGLESTLALARFALLHPVPLVQQSATKAIKTRPYHDYVPSILDMLSSPVYSMAVPVLGEGGTLTGFRQTFAQERRSQTDLFVLDTAIDYVGRTDAQRPAAIRIPEQNTNSVDTQSEALQRSSQQARDNSAAMQASNQQIVVRNLRIAQFLGQVADREFSQPSDIWLWWDEINETEYQALKASKVRYATSVLATRNYSELAASAMRSPFIQGECFRRGTPVVTRKGMLPIEALRVGDLVLSRDIPTGELSWKPIVRTTTRPPRPTFEIGLGIEKLSCTGGHLFWVSGKGWIKASQLKPGDILHAAAQPVVVMKVKQQPEAQTFNLAIDQTQTYFVGEQMIMSHDVTDRISTHLKVPGLSIEQE